MHRYIHCFVYLLASCLASSIGNLTVVESVNPKTKVAGRRIICPPLSGRPREDHLIDAALHFHRVSVGTALAGIKQGVSFPPFKAIFKTYQYHETISAVLEMSLAIGESPTFICIRSKEEAQYYEVSTRTPGLWQRCESGAATWAREIALFICPLFLERTQRAGNQQPKACPGVTHNTFYVKDGMPQLFEDRALEITKYLIVLYNPFKPYPTSHDPNVFMNLALSWTAEEAHKRLLSYLMYVQLMKNLCLEIPDVTKPPWNFPPTLEGNSVGNDTTSNINANATLPPSFTPLASLGQETPTDSIHTS